MRAFVQGSLTFGHTEVAPFAGKYIGLHNCRLRYSMLLCIIASHSSLRRTFLDEWKYCNMKGIDSIGEGQNVYQQGDA